MGTQTLITVAVWLLLNSLAQADALPPYAAKFPFATSVTSYGEINGSYFYSARGVVAESPRNALEKLKRAFGTDGAFAQVSPNKNHALFWQLRGFKTPTAKERKKIQKSIQELGGAMAIKIEARLATPPVGTVFWLYDLACSLIVADMGELCFEVDPLDIAIVMDGVMPKPQWHEVTLEERADGTHFGWSVWPEASLAGLFGMGNLNERKRNCTRAKHPRAYGSDCLIVGRFVNNASSGRVEIAHSPLPLAATEKYINEQLKANGWSTDPLFEPDVHGELASLAPSLAPAQAAMTLPGFQFLRHAGSAATLMVKMQAESEGGTQVFIIEMESGG